MVGKRVTHDELHRISERYCAAGVENALAAAAMAEHWLELQHLIVDELTAEAFQVAYCRSTTKYAGGDYVAIFKQIFFSTMIDFRHSAAEYKARRNGIPKET